jgi:hypothetical protein
MTNMKKIALSGVFIFSMAITSYSQGCVAIRNIAGFGQFAQLGYRQNDKKWMISIAARNFKAYQPIVGTEELPVPENKFTTYSFSTNFSISKDLGNNWLMAVDFPISWNSSVGIPEHKSGESHTTSAYGIGDVRIAVLKWLMKFNPTSKGNIQVGLGLKLPTGDYRFQDYFYYDPANPQARQLAPVDPSIQLGDGGTGFTAELNAFYIFNKHFSAYANFFYLINPRDQNGTSNQHNNPPANATDSLVYKSGMEVNSVPDNYTMRTGANFTLQNFVMTAGLRYEGAPARDLIGENNGLRRVGHIFSIEPGLQYKFRSGFLYSFVTLPLKLETIQTEPDKVYSELSGTYHISGGRFANYLVFVGYAFTF